VDSEKLRANIFSLLKRGDNTGFSTKFVSSEKIILGTKRFLYF